MKHAVRWLLHIVAAGLAVLSASGCALENLGGRYSGEVLVSGDCPSTATPSHRKQMAMVTTHLEGFYVMEVGDPQDAAFVGPFVLRPAPQERGASERLALVSDPLHFYGGTAEMTAVFDETRDAFDLTLRVQQEVPSCTSTQSGVLHSEARDAGS